MSTAPTEQPTCPACDRPLYSRHCKYVCPSHGVVFDCSDPFW
ncbi:HVO_2523 family zinc finger protein [Halodesulfurarchaeum formicicum]